MVKMLQATVALLSVTSAMSQISQGDQVTCAIDGVRAVDDLMDGVVYTMSSIARCNKDSGTGDETHCILDITQTIESVNKMVNVIMKAINKCGAIKADKPKCGVAVGKLTKSLATLTAASAGIVAKCPKDTGAKANVGGGFPRKCEVNIKDSVKSLLKAVKRAMSLKDDCQVPGSVECAHNTIKLTNALVGIAEYISGAVSKCSNNVGAVATAGCAQMSTKVVHAAGAVAEAGTALARFCAPTPVERLYLATVDAEESGATSAVSSPTFDASNKFLAASMIFSIGMVATMVVFVAGNKVSKKQDGRQGFCRRQEGESGLQGGRSARTPRDATYKYVDVEDVEE